MVKARPAPKRVDACAGETTMRTANGVRRLRSAQRGPATLTEPEPPPHAMAVTTRVVLATRGAIIAVASRVAIVKVVRGHDLQLSRCTLGRGLMCGGG